MLNDLLMIVATYLGLDDVNSYIDAINSEEEATAPESLGLLINLANLTIRRITRDYMPLYAEETIFSDDSCQIAFSAFSKTPVQIKSISTPDRISATFRCFPTFIKVGYSSRPYIVKYSYAPEEMDDLEDTIEKPYNLAIETIAYAVCFEYCIANELFSEADMWEERFKQAIMKDINGTRTKMVPKRGWV